MPTYTDVVQHDEDSWSWTETFLDTEGDWTAGRDIQCTRKCSVTLDRGAGLLRWSWSASEVPPGSYLSHPEGSATQALLHFFDMASGFGYHIPQEVARWARQERAARA